MMRSVWCLLAVSAAVAQFPIPGMGGFPMMGQDPSMMMGQPMMGQPMMGQPMMGQPMMGQPAMGQPAMGQPMMGQPMQMPAAMPQGVFPGFGFPQLGGLPQPQQQSQQPQPQPQSQTQSQEVKTPNLSDIFGNFGMGTGFGNFGGFGGLGTGLGWNKKASANAPPQENFLWICLEDIFPPDVRAQAGIPENVGSILSDYATHAYILHGPDVNTATGWQVTLNEGYQYWNQVLSDAKKMDMTNPVEWSKEKANQITGNTKISTAPGNHVYRNSRQCFKSHAPTKCSAKDMRQLSNTYLQNHPKFNLASDNCVAYACTMLHSCAAAEDNNESSCNLDTCKQNVMFGKLEDKSPTCGTELVMRRKESVPAFSANPLLALGMALGMGAKPTHQAKPAQASDPPELLREFMPMHFADAKKRLADFLESDSHLQ